MGNKKLIDFWKFWDFYIFFRFFENFQIFYFFRFFIFFSTFRIFENIFLHDEKIFFTQIFFCDRVCTSSILKNHLEHSGRYLVAQKLPYGQIWPARSRWGGNELAL